MKLLLIIICFPFLAAAQSGRQDDSLRKVSDTMHFPEPFMFKTSENTILSQDVLFKKCYDWLASVKDSLNGIVLSKDSVQRKITASNVPATADISYTIFITVEGSKYTCALQNYIFHTINIKQLPVEKAAMIKEYQKTADIERVIIMRNHQQIFNSLNKYLEKD